MLEEALVLGRNHGVDQNFRNFRESHQTPLFPIPVEQIGNQFRFQAILGSFRIVLQRDDLRDLIPAEHDDAVFLKEE